MTKPNDLVQPVPAACTCAPEAPVAGAGCCPHPVPASGARRLPSLQVTHWLYTLTSKTRMVCRRQSWQRQYSSVLRGAEAAPCACRTPFLS